MALEVGVEQGHGTRADQRRQEIAASAAALFEQSGYATASMGEIARAAGLAKPTLYHYFASKDEILFTIHEQFITTLMRRLAERDGMDLSASQHVQAVIEDVFIVIGTHQGHVRVFFEHYRELPPAQQEPIREMRDDYERRVQALIAAGMQSGEFRPSDPRLVVLALFGMCNWAYQWYRPNGPMEPQELARQFSAYLLAGLVQFDD